METIVKVFNKLGKFIKTSNAMTLYIVVLLLQLVIDFQPESGLPEQYYTIMNKILVYAVPYSIYIVIACILIKLVPAALSITSDANYDATYRLLAQVGLYALASGFVIYEHYKGNSYTLVSVVNVEGLSDISKYLIMTIAELLVIRIFELVSSITNIKYNGDGKARVIVDNKGKSKHGELIKNEYVDAEVVGTEPIDKLAVRQSGDTLQLRQEYDIALKYGDSANISDEEFVACDEIANKYIN